jgi:TRAP-type C4-dicarboxylate transport system permease small subunit
MEVPILRVLEIIFLAAALAVLRFLLTKKQRGKSLFRLLGFVEMGAVTLLIAGLIFFGCLQIVLRDFLQRGIIWADPLMRHMVLWLGCLGGALASSRMKHINIDVLSQLIPAKARSLRDRIIFSVTAVASSVLAAAALEFMLDEKAYGEKSFLDIGTWILQTVLPFAFFLIAYRSACHAISPSTFGKEHDSGRE